MAEPAKLRIRRSFPRPSQNELEAFQSASTGWVVDAQGGAVPSHTGCARCRLPAVLLEQH